MMKKPELLSPVNDFASLTSAINAGCNSVYFGTTVLNMRARARIFELNQLKKVADICHSNNVRCYLTLNTIAYDDELDKIEQVIKIAKESKIDAIICWDLAVIKLARKYNFEIHLSTQASAANFEAIHEYSKLGLSRIVLARELSLNQIKVIIDKIKSNKLNVEIETFVHGAMCVSVSGRCFISQFLYGKSANRGECLQPCRREYKVIDKETNAELQLGNNYILSPKDLMTIEILPLLIESGISVFKIEGRMKTPDYIFKTTNAYRKAIDYYFENNLSSNFKDNYALFIKKLIDDLNDVFNRDFHTGFYEKFPLNEFTDSYGSKAKITKQYVGKVKNFYNKISVADVLVQTQNNISIGDKIAIIGNTTGYKEMIVKEMRKNEQSIKKTNKNDRIGLKVDFAIRPNDKIFILIDNSIKKENHG